MEIMNVSSIVTTFDGKKIPRQNARRIKGQFYEIGLSCFRIKEKSGVSRWHRINNGKILKNDDTGKYELIESMADSGMSRAIINNQGEIGYITPNEYQNVALKDNLLDSNSTVILCKSKELAEELGYVENWSDGLFYSKKNLHPAALIEFRKKRTVSYGRSLSHNANFDNYEFLQAVTKHTSSIDEMKCDDLAESLAQIIGNLTFGIEFETSKGFVPERLLPPLGLVPLRDGSIGGTEFTTVPMSGKHGIQTIKTICELLSERCEVDYKCSLHLHIGGITRDYLHLLALYTTFLAIQKDMYNYVPPFKKDPVNTAGLEKNYCSPLKVIDFVIPQDLFINSALEEEFAKLYLWLTGEVKKFGPDSNLTTYRHPQDSSGNQKWNISNRYCIFNMIPTVFSRSHTVEFRLHHGTLNKTKVLNWLLINCAIINYVNTNAAAILKKELVPDLKSIIKGYECNFNYGLNKFNPFGAKVAEYLLAYLEARKDTFATYEKFGDWTCKSEYEKDGEFTFEHNGFTTAF